MKEGTFIHCHDLEEMKATLKELGDAGYGAVRLGYNTFIILITSVPKEAL